MTWAEKELVALQAEALGWSETARTVRAYLTRNPRTRSDVVRVRTLASAFGWDRLPGWQIVIEPRLPRLSAGGRR